MAQGGGRARPRTICRARVRSDAGVGAHRGIRAARRLASVGAGRLKKSHDLVALPLGERRVMIATLHAQEPTWSLRLLCQLLGVARSSYGYTPGGESAADMAVRDALEQIAVEFPRYGYRRMTVELGRRGIVANHKRVLALM